MLFGRELITRFLIFGYVVNTKSIFHFSEFATFSNVDALILQYIGRCDASDGKAGI